MGTIKLDVNESVECVEEGCSRPAMINQWPGRKSNRHLSRHCAPCAADYYTDLINPQHAILVNATLIEQDAGG